MPVFSYTFFCKIAFNRQKSDQFKEILIINNILDIIAKNISLFFNKSILLYAHYPNKFAESRIYIWEFLTLCRNIFHLLNEIKPKWVGKYEFLSNHKIKSKGHTIPCKHN